MRKAFELVLLTAGLLGLAGCNTPGCVIQHKAAEVAGNFTSSIFECEDVEGVKQELNDKVLSHTGLCKAGNSELPQGVLADTFCPIVSNTVVEFVKGQGQAFLDRHRCTAKNATSFSKEKLTALCKLIPLQPQS